MNYYFDQETGSFILKDYETGKKWENHIWNDNQFIVTVDHFGRSIARRVTAHGEEVYVDNVGEIACTYIRDDEKNEYWNIGYAPSFNDVEDYTCEHGLKFSKVSSSKNGISGVQVITVCDEFNAEVWKVTLKNNTQSEKKLSVFAFCKFWLVGLVQSRYYYPGNTGNTVFVPDANGVLCIQKSPFMPEDAYSGYIMSSLQADAFCGRLEHFTGTAGNVTKPYILENGLDLPNTNAYVRDRSGVIQNKITLAPGEEKTIYYAIGLSSSKTEDLVELNKKLMTNPERFFENLYEKGIQEFGALRTETPENRINNIMNFWVQKQISYCMIGKKAVRDNAQIALGMLNYNADLAKRTLEECIANQYYDGHALLTWSPFYRETDIYSDPSAWLILAVCEYIKESGDMEFLKSHIDFLDGEDGTVYDHLLKAAEWYMRKDNYGPNGLPRIHHADWNDALNIPDENAESVFMAMMICYAFKELSELVRVYEGDEDKVSTLLSFRDELANITNEKAYNGEYYVRAFSKFGVVGDRNDPNGGNIYVNPQVWSVLSSVVPEDRVDSVMAAVDNMETKDGVPLCSPPYSKYNQAVGRMSAMPPGVYENGGIYNHACAFKVMADCKLGRSEQAIGTLLKMIPDGEYNPSSKTTTEPYVFTNCYLKNEYEDMVVGFSWQTGSSAWALRDYYEGILGIERTYDGLRFQPNVPKSWNKVVATRPYRGNILQITYLNEGRNDLEIYVDGQRIEGSVVNAFEDNDNHEIIIKM